MVKIVDRYYLVTVIYSHKLKCCCFKMIFYFSFDIENGSTVIFNLILVYHYIMKIFFQRHVQIFENSSPDSLRV
jgi:hypothetical protein